MAGYPFRLPVRASVQVTSWRGPHFPRRRLNQGCPGTHCPRYRHFVRAEELQTSRVVQSDYEARALTQVLMPNTCLESMHVLRFSSQNPRWVYRKGTRTASSASHGWGGLWCAIGDECGTALRQPRTSRSAEDPSIEDRRTLMERGAHPLTHIGVWDCRNMGSGPRSATKLIANGMAPMNLEKCCCFHATHR